MARIGISPTRRKISRYQPARVTAGVISYIPELKGYHSQRLEILKLTLGSLRKHTPAAFDLMVFDNGSCEPAVEYLRELRDTGAIDYLILSSRNIGKIGAFRVLFNAAPGKIVAYSDDDILFYPSWLEAHLEILETYPQVGMVSGLPVRNLAERASESLNKMVESPPEGLTVHRERRIREEWEADWARSTGRDPIAHLVETKDVQDLIFRYQGVEAFASANHFQFVSYKQVLTAALPTEWSGRLMGEMIEFDEAVDRQGLIRLSTMERYTRHLGNALTDELREEFNLLGLSSPDRNSGRKARRGKHWLLNIPGARRILVWLYDRLFQIIFGGR